MQASIEHVGSDLFCRSAHTEPSELRLEAEPARACLEDWARRYDAAQRGTGSSTPNGLLQSGQDPLLGIGRELFNWLDTTGWVSAWPAGTGSRALTIRVDDPSSAIGRALLDAPWELLAGADGFLAQDAVQPFELVRRTGRPADPAAPRHSDLQLMFMAAAPDGERVLDYEAEEAAILQATRRLPLHLVVEESGTAELLSNRLDLDGPFEALHISCHGDIDPGRGPVLALEDAVGDRAPAGPGELAHCLGPPERTRLVFLSACRGAEQDDGARRFEPFVHALVRAGVSNVLGWDGSVGDLAATVFAEHLYRGLAGYESLPLATARARRTVLADPEHGQHWHTARLCIGPAGGGARAARGLLKRRLAGASNEQHFLDTERGEVPVAARAAFVGRRRQAQAVLRAFSDDAAGVLIHGMGSLGKSSLAARIASRMTGHRSLVIFRGYDALSVFDRVVEAIPASRRQGFRDSWRNGLLANPATLAEALEALLEDPFDQAPILLIIDDLESILRTPDPSQGRTPVQPDYRAPLAAVLSTFAKARTASRLLLTSRYRFTLPDASGRDLADGLVLVPCPALEAAAAADSIAEPTAALDRLLALGLADHWGTRDDIPRAAANPLARPLAPPLQPVLAARMGAAALPILDRLWRDSDGGLPWDQRGLELTRLTLAAPELDPDLLIRAAEAAARWLYATELDAKRAHNVVLRPSHGLLLIAMDCARLLGDDEAEDLALAGMRDTDAKGLDGARTSLYVARREHRQGHLESAERSLESAARAYRETGEDRECAIARGEIADILMARGQLDEALALHDERVKIAEDLGDIDLIAHVRFRTAQIRLARGDHQTGGLQQIHDDLAEAFTILSRMGRADGIGAVGLLLAQVLAAGGIHSRPVRCWSMPRRRS